MKNQDDTIKIHILFARNTKKNYDLLSSRHLSIFPLEYVKRITKYRKWQDIQASVIGRLLLYEGLKNFYDYKLNFNMIQTDSFKRPFLLNSQIDFNISHSTGIVVCAMTRKCKIGVDIEKIKKVTVQHFSYQMTKLELNKVIGSKNLYKEFYLYWTQKEATLKANGKGLYIPLKSFEIFNNETCLNGQKYFIIPIKIDEQYICHLASTTKIFANEILLTEIKF